MGKQLIDRYQLVKLQAELEQLDNTPLGINGKKMLASQCYYFEVNPFHILYNMNCPEHLKARIEEIASKYISDLQ